MHDENCFAMLIYLHSPAEENKPCFFKAVYSRKQGSISQSSYKVTWNSTLAITSSAAMNNQQPSYSWESSLAFQINKKELTHFQSIKQLLPEN